MKFMVTRVSSVYSDPKPCDEAEWSEEGRYWVVELATLKDLINFMKKIDEDLIISKYDSDYYGKPYEIIIFDGYL